MGRVPPLAAAIVVAWTAPAVAGGPTQKVTIETDPAGGTVYLNDVESGPVCPKPTPCTFDAPIGTGLTLIIQKAGFAPVTEAIDVPKRPKKPLVFKYHLDAVLAAIVIDNPAAKGATVSIDDAPKGKVDSSGNARIEVEPGGHNVKVASGGKIFFEDIVDVKDGEDTKLKLDGGGGGGGGDKGGGGGDGEGEGGDKGGGDGDKSGGEISAGTSTPPAGRYFAGGVIIDVGFRRFEYQNPSGALAPESEDGQVIGGPAIEVWPGEILDIDVLRGLSLIARFELPLNHQDVIGPNGQPLGGGTSTYWSSGEASLQYKYRIGDTATVAASAGYVRDEYRFNTDAATDTMLPDATYSSLRLGARASVLLGPAEPYLTIENRVVFDGGALGSPTRFATASTSGFKGSFGIAGGYGHIVGRVEGSYSQYGWTFTNNGGAAAQADGATDKVMGIAFAVGYQY